MHKYKRRFWLPANWYDDDTVNSIGVNVDEKVGEGSTPVPSPSLVASQTAGGGWSLEEVIAYGGQFHVFAFSCSPLKDFMFLINTNIRLFIVT